ncbi:MAG: tRNA glutamyl-Q(34) synthetase GluQRS [Gammaproteobacteria bacterium]
MKRGLSPRCAWKRKSVASYPSDNSATGTTVTGNPDYRGRFAPSPTGLLHLGSLAGALVSYLDARAHDGTWFVRIDDIDPPREVPGAADAILRTLERHALLWDERVYYQSTSARQHLDAANSLHAAGQAYHCDCARRALKKSGLLGAYPGTCRTRGLSAGALRVIVNGEPVTIADRWQGTHHFQLEQRPGDFIVRRRDGLIAYQLACAVDDADQQITDVVRGVDLFDSTPRQVYLQRQLGLPEPRYAHFPVLVGADGDKLSKQTGATAVDDTTPAANLFRVLHLLGFEPPREIAHHPPEQVIDWATQRYVTSQFNATQTIALD